VRVVAKEAGGGERASPVQATPNPRLAALLRQAAAGNLACPYCQDALRAQMLGVDRVQFRCPTCGFVEAPDRLEDGRR